MNGSIAIINPFQLQSPNASQNAQPPSTVKLIKPTQPAMNTTVRIPAPALSPVVMAFCLVVDEVVSFSPCVGLLVLFPPVVDVTGAVVLN